MATRVEAEIRGNNVRFTEYTRRRLFGPLRLVPHDRLLNLSTAKDTLENERRGHKKKAIVYGIVVPVIILAAAGFSALTFGVSIPLFSAIGAAGGITSAVGIADINKARIDSKYLQALHVARRRN